MKPRVFLQTISAFFISAILFTTVAFAQDSAALSGTVTDSSGAVLAGGTVQAVSLQDGGERVVTANSDGNFSIQGLRAGNYKVSVTQTGFKVSKIDLIEIGVAKARFLQDRVAFLGRGRF